MLFEFTLVILVAAIGGFIAKYSKQPAVIGYLLAGFTASVLVPSFLRQKEALDSIAQIGVALLLFTLGIECNIRRISRVVKIAVLGGFLQIIFSSLIYSVALTFLGFPQTASFIVAVGFSFSSTAVVIKILNEKKMLTTLTGEIIVAWLLIQDLTVIPVLIALPFLKDGIQVSLIPQMLIPLVTVIYLIVMALWFGRTLVSYLVKKIALFNSQELLLLTTFTLCLLVAGFTQWLGLSFALGAFIAGMMMSESLEHHAVFSEIRPLRDLFSAVFFVTLPLLAAPEHILGVLPMAITLSILVISVKFTLVVLIAWYFGYHSKVSFLVGIGLVQVGEFAFILVREGLRLGLITEQTYTVVLMVTIFTIVVTPYFFTKGIHWYERLRSFCKMRSIKLYTMFFTTGNQGMNIERLPFKDHVVLVGYGRMGKYIGRALHAMDIPYLVIEINRAIVEKLSGEKIPVLFGDPSDKDILEYAQVDSARAVVITIPDLSGQLSVIVNVRKLKPSILIVSRTQYEADQKVLKGAGADMVIHPEFTASVAVSSKLLALFNHGREEIDKRVARLKIEHGME